MRRPAGVAPRQTGAIGGKLCAESFRHTLIRLAGNGNVSLGNARFFFVLSLRGLKAPVHAVLACPSSSGAGGKYPAKLTRLHATFLEQGLLSDIAIHGPVQTFLKKVKKNLVRPSGPIIPLPQT